MKIYFRSLVSCCNPRSMRQRRMRKRYLLDEWRGGGGLWVRWVGVGIFLNNPKDLPHRPLLRGPWQRMRRKPLPTQRRNRRRHMLLCGPNTNLRRNHPNMLCARFLFVFGINKFFWDRASSFWTEIFSGRAVFDARLELKFFCWTGGLSDKKVIKSFLARKFSSTYWLDQRWAFGPPDPTQFFPSRIGLGPIRSSPTGL